MSDTYVIIQSVIDNMCKHKYVEYSKLDTRASEAGQ